MYALSTRLSPTATHGLLLKPSLHARRYPRDVPVCLQPRNGSMRDREGRVRGMHLIV
jgi:hypothetical protein